MDILSLAHLLVLIGGLTAGLASRLIYKYFKNPLIMEVAKDIQIISDEIIKEEITDESLK